MEPTIKPKVLAVDDEQSNLDTLGRVFRLEYDFKFANSAVEALRLIKEFVFDICIVDHAMPGMSGVELLRLAKREQPEMGRIMLTAFGDLPEVMAAHTSGLSAAIIMKPWKKDDIQRWVNHFAKMTSMRRAVSTLKSTMDATAASAAADSAMRMP
jgi:DNA-binding NtrC family response regulator